MQDLLELAKQKMEDFGWFRLPVMPIHGDFCQFNCRFEGRQVVGIVDWDHSRLGPRLLDIAHALNIGLGRRGSIEYYEDFRWYDSVILEPDTLESWFKSYARYGFPLSEEEAQLLPFTCAVMWIEESAGFYPTSSVEMPNCDAIVKYLRHLLQETKSISNIVRSCIS